MRAGLCLLLMAFAGCGPSNQCEGPVPTIAQCRGGFAWADCGGTGVEPRFACDGLDCVWFARGCVAQGYEASPCPADDLCCRDGAPFDGPRTGTWRDFGVSAETGAWGTAPWDATRERNVSVIVGGVESVPVRPTGTCGISPLLSDAPCGPRAMIELIRGHVGDASYISVYDAADSAVSGGHAFTLELIPDPSGEMMARFCSIPGGGVMGDAYGLCAAGEVPACATAGRIVLPTVPPTATTPIDVDVTFADGATVALRL